MRPRHPERGAALVELALTVPMLLVVLVGIADFARVFHYASGLTDAVRAGAQRGSQTVIWNAAAAQSSAQAASPTTQPYSVATPTRTCGCIDAAGGNYAAAACTDSCPTGRHMIAFVTVTATKTFTATMSVGSFPPPITLTRTATMRAQ